MNVLVTGGCGFIGQELVRQLVERYGAAAVWVLDARTRAATGWYRVQKLGVRVERGDVQDAELVHRLLQLQVPDVVVHCAAQSHVDASLQEPSATWLVNAIGTQVVAEACTVWGVPLVYCSTDEVYGSTPVDEEGKTKPVREDAPLNPSSPYSASKAAGEHAVRSMGHSAGLVYAITRGSNAWGPCQLGEKLVPLACSLLQQGSPVPLHGGGDQLRQWVHVAEFADALHTVAAALTVGKGAGQTFNIAGPELMSVRQLVLALAAQAGVPEALAVWASEDRPGQDGAYHVSGDALRHAMGWLASRKISDPAELAGLLEHYAENDTTALVAEYVSAPRTPA